MPSMMEAQAVIAITAITLDNPDSPAFVDRRVHLPIRTQPAIFCATLVWTRLPRVETSWILELWNWLVMG